MVILHHQFKSSYRKSDTVAKLHISEGIVQYSRHSSLDCVSSFEIPHLFSMLCYRVIFSKKKYIIGVIGQFFLFFLFYRGELKYLNYESAILFVCLI